MLLRELHKQAQLEGGAVYMLNGNHESLNVSGNFRYDSAGGYTQQPGTRAACLHQLCSWHMMQSSLTGILSSNVVLTVVILCNTHW